MIYARSCESGGVEPGEPDPADARLIGAEESARELFVVGKGARYGYLLAARASPPFGQQRREDLAGTAAPAPEGENI